MNFSRAECLWLWVLIPPLAAWVARGRRKRAREWADLGQGGRLGGDGSWGRLAAVACLAAALAGPRWGKVAGGELPPGHDVVLLVDVSRSMGAEDAVPDRLGAAVGSAGRLVEALGGEPGGRAAVVAFAGRGVVRCPMTEDLGAAAEALEALRPGDVRPGGTDLGAGLEAALEAFDDQEASGGRTIVLLSDGEDHAGTWRRLLPRLRDARIVVHAVAVGDPDRGHPVPSGSGGILTYRGKPVASRRADAPLEALARETGGAFIPLGLSRADLGALYAERIAPLVARRRASEMRLGRPERSPIFVGLALAMVVAGLLPGRPGGVVPARLARLALAALFAMGASPGLPIAEEIEAGREAYRSGAPDAGLAAFERAIALDPGAAIPRYDAGAALFRLRRFEEAAARYREARERGDAGLRAKIDFALGDTSLARGDIPGALRHFDDCLASRAPGPAYDAVRRDALANRRFAEALSWKPPDDPGKRPPRNPTGENPSAKSEGPVRPPSESPDRGEGGQSPQAPGRGGAGGTGAAPPRAGSPEARLAEALDHIRAARPRRLSVERPSTPEEDRMDW